MEENIEKIKKWLGTGSVNIFGMPMSGKDTQGMKLAEAIGGEFISSGVIIREKEKETKQEMTASGQLIPTNIFYQWVLPYLGRKELRGKPLVLSSIGRWKGEEDSVMSSAAGSGHDIMAVVLLELTEDEVKKRFALAGKLGDRGERADDKDLGTFQTRIREFREKTLPVIEYYRELGMLLTVDGNQDREMVFEEMVRKLAKWSEK